MSSDLTKQLLDWYTHYGRDLPWRVKGGPHPDPYVILVSEFMLQQTTVKTVLSYFPKFISRFPTVQSLAAATIEEVYLYWQGLGYYSRARALHTSAQMIVKNFGGQFPKTKEDILKLKGIGTYTAASFLALAYNQPETVVDGNVIRVICRLYHLTNSTDKILPEIRTKATALTPHQNAADYTSAIMDLGAVICTPQKPQCLICPWQKSCLSCSQSDIESIPQRKKLTKKIKTGYVYLIQDEQNRFCIRQRTEKGLLSGLWEFPWTETSELLPNTNLTNKEVSHVFTHFKLTLKICCAPIAVAPADGKFVCVQDFKNYAFSTLMKKVWQTYQNQAKKQLPQ